MNMLFGFVEYEWVAVSVIAKLFTIGYTKFLSFTNSTFNTPLDGAVVHQTCAVMYGNQPLVLGVSVLASLLLAATVHTEPIATL
jgi:hypothetical protein